MNTYFYFIEYVPYGLLGLGLYLLLTSVTSSNKRSKLKKSGCKAEGIFFEQEEAGYFNFYSRFFQMRVYNSVTVRFVTEDKQWITGTINQEFQFFYPEQYEESENVIVYYDRENPATFYMDSKQSARLVKIIFILSGLILSVYGLYCIYH